MNQGKLGKLDMVKQEMAGVNIDTRNQWTINKMNQNGWI